MTTDRERFLAALFTGNLTQADAIVLLTGDGESRIATAVGLFHAHAAPKIVVSGGVHAPPYALTAGAIARLIYGKGVATDRVIVEQASRNTHDSAVNLIDMAVREEWARLILVTSPYHLPRAFLSFVAELQARTLAEKVCVVPMPTGGSPWFVRVTGEPGRGQTRLDLLAGEFSKIDEYREFGHVASYRDGLDYIERWESK